MQNIQSIFSIDHSANQSEFTVRVNTMEETVRKNTDKMFRTALAVTRSKADAEVAVQDAFVRLFEKKPVFESDEHETSWLIRVTVNICKNRLRSAWRRKTVPMSELLETYPAPDSESHNLMEMVLALPAKYRTVIHLYYYEGYATKEIAEITKQKDSTVREQLTRARRMLKNYIEEEEELL